MPFENGNQLYKERITSSGYPGKKVIADRALASKIAEERIAKSFGDLIKHGIKLAIKGVKRRKFYPKDHPTKPSHTYWEIEYDMATWRFLVERFLPPAKQSIDVNLKTGFEALIQELDDEERREKEAADRARLIQPDPDEEWK